MNYRFIIKRLGALLAIEAVCMIPALIVSMAYNEGSAPAFCLSITILTAFSIIFNMFKPKNADFYPRDGFAMVGIGWMLCALFGALPYLISGTIPSVVDALFESVSGFSTTSSTILRDVEFLPKGIVFWRSFTNWMGGMGVLVLMIAIMPSVKANSIHIMRAEAPGPYIDKFMPRISWVARILYRTYFLFTAAEVIFLLFGGMPLFDAIIHAMSTTSTGGFSNRNLSIGEYNSLYIEIVVSVFMLLCAVNMSLYQMAWRGKIKAALKDSEMHLFLFIFLAAILIIVIDLVSHNETFSVSVRGAFFQVSSLISSTCFASVDFEKWPVFSKTILLLIMFIGGCGGSTSGGIKCMRILLLIKIVKNDLAKILHPNSVHVVRFNGKPMEDSVLIGVQSYFFLYILMIVISTLIVSLNGFEIQTSFSACLSAISNMGPGLGIIGPMGNYADFSILSKIVLMICMLLGRLEIYPILVLFMPSFWKQMNKW